LIQRLARRGKRLNQHGTGLAVQPSTDDHHAVFILIHVQGAVSAPTLHPGFRASLECPQHAIARRSRNFQGAPPLTHLAAAAARWAELYAQPSARDRSQ